MSDMRCTLTTTARTWVSGKCELQVCRCKGTGHARKEPTFAALTMPTNAIYEVVHCDDCGHVTRFEFKEARA